MKEHKTGYVGEMTQDQRAGIIDDVGKIVGLLGTDPKGGIRPMALITLALYIWNEHGITSEQASKCFESLSKAFLKRGQ